MRLRVPGSVSATCFGRDGARARSMIRCLTVILGLLLSVEWSVSQDRPKRGGPGGRKGQDQQTRQQDKQRPPKSEFFTQSPAHDYDVILGRPEQDRVTVSVLSYSACDGYIAFGTSREALDRKTSPFSLTAGQPQELLLDNLVANTAYSYQVCLKRAGATTYSVGQTHEFHTQRAPGAPFTFTITADSHLDERVSTSTYQQTLLNVAQVKPDFHIDLGDTFMTEKHRDRESASRQYVAQRYYFGLLAQSAPIFLVLGNHDGEGARWAEGGADSLAVWSNLMRKRYFPNPLADRFYTGNSAPDRVAGLLQDYYAWEWGDALFVVLDPFWFTPKSGGASDNWVNTLGQAQYAWLQRTLQQSKAKFRFVFLHNLVGGADRQSRGGAEAAPFYEWGGKNADGSDGFQQHRPGWGAPIHELLVRNHVSAVFHGHDHLYAQQELDGVVYQLVPQPATPGARNFRENAEEYGYRKGVILPSPGYLKVSVGASSCTVAYYQTGTSAPVAEYQVKAR